MFHCSLLGDIISLPNLFKILELPTDGGEQNMAETAINLIMAFYTTVTDQSNDFIAKSLLKKMEMGGLDNSTIVLYNKDQLCMLFSQAISNN